MTKLSLVTLPAEIIWLIGGQLKTEKDISALMRANTVLYRLLLRNLYKRNIDQSGSSALVWCSMKGSEESVRLLVSMRANVDCAYRFPGQSEWDSAAPLHVAANERIAKILLDHGANINIVSYRGDTALHRAAVNRHLALASFLLDRGININVSGHIDRSSYCICHTALHLAVQNQDYRMARLFIEWGADLEIKNGFWERPLHLAVSKNCESITKLLIDYGADLNAQDFFQQTPLHGAVASGNVSLARVLVVHGSCLALKDNKGQTASDIATQNGNGEMLDILNL
ncbi:hypothetical protein N7509_012946 [Penicillium cosmopolitanum]|uniref:F-box domain-containing protein n=1 Tax=Penicillium cosmopolitanum TaxID=1131564 RepID=A0A9W9VE07_9EURO|nr:uncharacterized protein N7509_012946 [Penicillium cosmopolitanum]KAJ5376060.1 hypothetical protein N7509_012946 [Penicillium cosmopolitanum]